MHTIVVRGDRITVVMLCTTASFLGKVNSTVYHADNYFHFDVSQNCSVSMRIQHREEYFSDAVVLALRLAEDFV